VRPARTWLLRNVLNLRANAPAVSSRAGQAAGTDPVRS
jgi:hypothetical protein